MCSPTLSPNTTSIVTRELDTEVSYCHKGIMLADDVSLDIRNAVNAHMPSRVGERRKKLFLLAKRLKAIEPTAAAERWLATIETWWQMALPVIGTKEWKTTWSDFCSAWEDCRPASVANDRFGEARRLALAESGSDAKIRAVCKSLSGSSDGGVFMLASTLAADLTGLSQKTAYNALQRMIDRGEIVIVERSVRMAYGVGHTYRMTER